MAAWAACVAALAAFAATTIVMLRLRVLAKTAGLLILGMVVAVVSFSACGDPKLLPPLLAKCFPSVLLHPGGWMVALWHARSHPFTPASMFSLAMLSFLAAAAPWIYTRKKAVFRAAEELPPPVFGSCQQRRSSIEPKIDPQYASMQGEAAIRQVWKKPFEPKGGILTKAAVARLTARERLLLEISPIYLPRPWKKMFWLAIAVGICLFLSYESDRRDAELFVVYSMLFLMIGEGPIQGAGSIALIVAMQPVAVSEIWQLRRRLFLLSWSAPAFLIAVYCTGMAIIFNRSWSSGTLAGLKLAGLRAALAPVGMWVAVGAISANDKIFRRRTAISYLSLLWTGCVGVGVLVFTGSLTALLFGINARHVVLHRWAEICTSWPIIVGLALCNLGVLVFERHIWAWRWFDIRAPSRSVAAAQECSDSKGNGSGSVGLRPEFNRDAVR